MTKKIHSLVELMQALAGKEPGTIEILASIVCPYAIVLPDGFSLKGGDRESCVISFNNGDGIGITSNNVIENLTILTRASCRAVYLQTGLADMGIIRLSNLSITGQVSLITRGGTNKIRVIAENIDISSCDARFYSEQPQKYGVNVYQGAFTLYNFNGDPATDFTANLTNISAGRKNAPVYGSGIFISGFGDNGGYIQLEQLTTGAVYSHGLLPYGTADIITGGVFINYGVKAKSVINNGEIVTYGVNDMVLDNWGEVENWTAREKILSYGPSGIGFVNFGTAGTFTAEQDIITYGLGARGFNQYDGTVKTIKLKSVTTYGNGSVGIQISKPIGSIEIEESIITYGSLGNSLFKGILMELPALAFSIKPGGQVESLHVKGDLSTYGDNIDTCVVEGGMLKQIVIGGTISANGHQSNAIHVKNGGSIPLTHVQAFAKSGKSLLNENGYVTDTTGYQENN